MSYVFSKTDKEKVLNVVRNIRELLYELEYYNDHPYDVPSGYSEEVSKIYDGVEGVRIMFDGDDGFN